MVVGRASFARAAGAGRFVATPAAAWMAWLTFASSACVEPAPDGTTGRLGKLVFQAPTDLVWSSRLVSGSTFAVTVLARSEKNALSDDATVAVDDDSVVGLDEIEVAGGELRFRVTARSPGRADLIISDGETAIDRIGLQAAAAVDAVLVDAALVGGTDAVDPRLPGDVAVVADAETRVLVSAVDRCGEALLDLGASSVSITVPEGIDPDRIAVVNADGPAAFVVAPVAAGDFAFTLNTPGLAPLAWDVVAVERSRIDEVRVAAATADAEAGTVTLWGRAFVDDLEVVGSDFTWEASERVTLSATSGPATIATIAFADADQPPDDRPATVTAELVGEEGTLDLFALTEGELVVARGEPPQRPAEADREGATDDAVAAAGAGCGADAPCDPFVAGVALGGLRFGRRRRRP
jgi:hypothetical protein